MAKQILYNEKPTPPPTPTPSEAMKRKDTELALNTVLMSMKCCLWQQQHILMRGKVTWPYVLTFLRMAWLFFRDNA
jgi:hypothetical protein